MFKNKILGLGLASLIFYEVSAFDHRRTLALEMKHKYAEMESVTDLSDIFSEGAFYGHFRTNTFIMNWEHELTTDTGSYIQKDHLITGIGGSGLLRTAQFYGFSATAGYYFSQAIGTLNDADIHYYGSGRSVFSRYDYLTTGRKNIGVFAEAFVQYENDDSTVRVGRQVFHSFLAAPHDVFMIPVTFEGVSLEHRFEFNTAIKAAYFPRMKLRDHSRFHHVFAVGDDPANPYSRFSQNDDSGMHRGIKLSELQARGIDDRLIILEATNISFKNVSLRANYTAVPELISSAMIEAGYHLVVDDWFIRPTVRYMHQFDDGAGAIGGANIRNRTSGYANPYSLDSYMIAARVDFIDDTFKLRLGYTAVADKGDLVAPWRGFPTGGFTRIMNQRNWLSNTRSYLTQLDYIFHKLDDLKIVARFVVQDFDDNKIGVQTDTNIASIDFLKSIWRDTLSVKLRYMHVMADPDVMTLSGVKKRDISHDEIRFEINYLF